MKTKFLIIIIFAALILFGFVALYQVFESKNNEVYCNYVSSKFCKPNPLQTTLLSNPENNAVNKMNDFSRMMETGQIDGFSFSSDGFSISSNGAMIKDLYFEDPDVPVLTLSLEFFKSFASDPLKSFYSIFKI